MLSRVGSKALRVLDRPGRRGLLTVPGSVWVSWNYRTPCLVRWEEGRWVHHYRGAKIPHAGFGRAAPPHVLTSEARDIFLYAYTPTAGDVVFDVGAGIGAETLLFSRLVGPSGRVVAIEAHPRTYARLVDLANLNHLDNVTTLQLAVADTEGSVTLSDTAHHVQNAVVAKADGGIRVAAKRLDAIANELAITHVDFLKMNIEGAERVALPSAGSLLGRTQHVCISCHDFLADAGGSDMLRTKVFVREYLTSHGFAITTRDDAAEPWTRDYIYGSRS